MAKICNKPIWSLIYFDSCHHGRLLDKIKLRVTLWWHFQPVSATLTRAITFEMQNLQFFYWRWHLLYTVHSFRNSVHIQPCNGQMSHKGVSDRRKSADWEISVIFSGYDDCYIDEDVFLDGNFSGQLPSGQETIIHPDFSSSEIGSSHILLIQLIL